MNLLIRNESEKDYREVEEVTREAFWNLHVPGCDEHYLAHVMRHHPDFIPELDFVAIMDDKIVGNIMYTKSHLISDTNQQLDTLTFGPVSVLPDYQKRGIGSSLIQHSIAKATAMGYKVIVIEGYPYNYCKHGFVGSKSLNVSDNKGNYPYSLLVLELEIGCLQNHSWKCHFSDVFELDENESNAFDTLFLPKEKGYRPSQEEFRITCNAYVDEP